MNFFPQRRRRYDYPGRPSPTSFRHHAPTHQTLHIHPERSCADSADDDVMDIQLVVVPGCPNEAPAAALLRAALDQAGIPDQSFRVTHVTDEQAATHNGFIGSPTFLINGLDPFGDPAQPTGMTCRLYRQPSGPALGLPAQDDLQYALATAARQPAPATAAHHG